MIDLLNLKFVGMDRDQRLGSLNLCEYPNIRDLGLNESMTINGIEFIGGPSVVVTKNKRLKKGFNPDLVSRLALISRKVAKNSSINGKSFYLEVDDGSMTQLYTSPLEPNMRELAISVFYSFIDEMGETFLPSPNNLRGRNLTSSREDWSTRLLSYLINAEINDLPITSQAYTPEKLYSRLRKFFGGKFRSEEDFLKRKIELLRDYMGLEEEFSSGAVKLDELEKLYLSNIFQVSNRRRDNGLSFFHKTKPKNSFLIQQSL